MSPAVPRVLSVALCVALAAITCAPAAHAEQDSFSEKRAKRAAERNKQDAGQTEKAPAKYPNATRAAPEPKLTDKMVKQLNELHALYEKPDMPGVIAKTEQIVAMPAAGAYEKAFAFSLAGNAAADIDDQDKAAAYFQKAIDADGLENDNHYNTMYNLAVIQYGNEKYADALVTVDRFLAETKSDKTDHLAMRAGILANLDRNDEAAAIYKDLVAKNPTDKRLLMNAVAILQSAEKFDQATVLLEDAYKRGMLVESRELRALYVGYMNVQRWDEALKVIDEGVAKGILKDGPELANDYQVLAQNAYADDKIPLAISLYSKAAPMTSTGDAYLNLAKVLDYAGKKAEAKAAAQKALDKGLKNPEDAKKLLAR